MLRQMTVFKTQYITKQEYDLVISNLKSPPIKNCVFNSSSTFVIKIIFIWPENWVIARS